MWIVVLKDVPNLETYETLFKKGEIITMQAFKEASRRFGYDYITGIACVTRSVAVHIRNDLTSVLTNKTHQIQN
jgi:hypothetical protein